MKLYMVRHGQTPYNNLKRIQGHIDIPLDDIGQTQAFDAATYFNDQKINIDVIVSSPLTRAIQTAQIIKNTLNHMKDIVVFEAFIERNFGDLDGMTIADAFPLIGNNYQAPGYETDLTLIKRITSGINHLYTLYKDQTVLAIVHSQVIKAVFVHLDPKTYSFVNFTILNGEITCFEINHDHIKHIK
jgi:uncharacterized phosphatase